MGIFWTAPSLSFVWKWELHPPEAFVCVFSQLFFFAWEKKCCEFDMILIQRPLLIQHKTSGLSLHASSERLSKHSAGYLQYFMATYKTIGYQILVRHCGPRGKQNLKLTEAQDYCAGLAALPPEMHGSQNPMSCRGRADPELVTVRVPYSLVIALEDSWRVETPASHHQSVRQALQPPFCMDLAATVPSLFMVPEGKCQSIQTFTNLF